VTNTVNLIWGIKTDHYLIISVFMTSYSCDVHLQ